MMESYSRKGNSRDFHEIREESLIDAFRRGRGKRVIFLTSQFPFMTIGVIKRVEADFAYILVETTNIEAFDGRVMRVHLDSVETFYIEKTGCPIPRLKNHGCCPPKGGDHKC